MPIYKVSIYIPPVDEEVVLAADSQDEAEADAVASCLQRLSEKVEVESEIVPA
jgi:hypothetical protein